MRRSKLSELVELMQPAEAELFGDDATVGKDVVLDNRHATEGSLFVGIPGAHVDGHDFARRAVESGAAAVLGTHVTKADVPHLLVPDSVAGLSALARGLVARERGRGMVSLAVTGSSGKTSTKDLLAQILESVGPTVAPVGSYNNEIGVPMTACRIDEDTRFLVSEMGARGIGHITWLTSLVPPDVAAVLNIGRAHVGEFGDMATTALAKSELIAALPEDGWAILNGNDEAVIGMRERTRARIAWFGEGDLPEGDLQVLARDVVLNGGAQPSFQLVVRRGNTEETTSVQLGVVGRTQVSNALAAAAMALAAGVGIDEIAAALCRATRRSSWRMELTPRTDDVLVLNDAYNANPDSMAAALRTAAELGQFQRDRYPDARVVAVVGDMLELGPLAEGLHRDVGRLAADLRINEVVAVGEFAEHVRDGAHEEGVVTSVAERDEVVGMLDLKPGDVVLVKGSRGVGLEAVAHALTGEREAPE